MPTKVISTKCGGSMKLTLAEIVSAWDPLVKLADRELPIKNAFILGKVIKTLGEERQNIENAKITLFQRYGAADPENPDQIKVDPDKMPDLLKEWNQFLEQEIEINIEPLNEKFIEDISYVNMTGRELSFLYPLMQEYINEKGSNNKNK